LNNPDLHFTVTLNPEVGSRIFFVKQTSSCSNLCRIVIIICIIEGVKRTVEYPVEGSKTTTSLSGIPIIALP
jgi:hypothetical protein